MEKTVMTFREFTLKFITFLKENNALKAFKQNMIKQHPERFKNLYNYINPLTTDRIESGIVDYKTPKGIIDRAFCWEQTKQGHNFWSNLNRKWDSKIKNVELVNENIYN